MERELILQEIDEENGTEYFKQSFYDVTGFKFDPWRKKAKLDRIENETGTRYTLDTIEVEITQENPFYAVYETTKTESND